MLCFTLLVILHLEFAHGHILYTEGTDTLTTGVYREGNPPRQIKQKRICTECSYKYRDNCNEKYWDIVKEYGIFYWKPKVIRNITDPSPWEISKQHMYMSCLPKLTKSPPTKGRRKRDNLGQHLPNRRHESGYRHIKTIAMSKDNINLLERSHSYQPKGHSNNHQRNRRDTISPHTVERSLIFINNAYFGRQVFGRCPQDSIYDTCHENVFKEREYLVLCNGRTQCWDIGIPKYLHTCERLSQFYHIEYQCIPENLNLKISEGGQTSTMDTTSSYGYIMSPRYPHEYGEFSAYECYLRMDKRDTNTDNNVFVFEVLDFHLEEGDIDSCCVSDWVELQALENLTITHSKRYCGYTDPGSSIRVESSVARMVFMTDHSEERRGFWIKYSGYSGTMPVPVYIECKRFNPDLDWQPERASTEDTHYKDCHNYMTSNNETQNWTKQPIYSDFPRSSTVSTTNTGNMTRGSQNQGQDAPQLSTAAIGAIGAIGGIVVLAAVLGAVVFIKRRYPDLTSSSTNPEKQESHQVNKMINKDPPQLTKRENVRYSGEPSAPAVISQPTYHNARHQESSHEYIPKSYLELQNGGDDNQYDSIQDGVIYEELQDFKGSNGTDNLGYYDKLGGQNSDQNTYLALTDFESN